MSLNIMNDDIKKIGILGGTFDPVHIGHLFLAEAAYDALKLDRVLFMPAKSPYYRTDRELATAQYRCQMIRIAIRDNPHFELSEFEMNLPGEGYTADTLESFFKANPDCELYFIIGGDALFTIESWKEPERIFKNATILAAKRQGQQLGESGNLIPSAENFSGEDLQTDFETQVERLKKKYGAKIIPLDVPCIDVSSSDILDRINNGRSVNYYMPLGVVRFILENKVYPGVKEHLWI